MPAKSRILTILSSLLLILLLAQPLLYAQEATLLPDPLIAEIIEQVSGEQAWWHVLSLSQYHRIQPSSEYHRAALYVEDKAKEYGLKNVRIEQFVADGKTMNFTFRTRPAWDAEKGELWIVEPMKRKIADFDDIRVSLATYSRDAHVTAELVDVGSGESAQDYQGKDVKGKIVLASGNPGAVHSLAVFEHGALGVVSYYTIAWQNTRQPGDYPDQVTWGRIEPESDTGQKSTFAFMISYRTGTMLKNMLANGQKVVLKADVKARVYAGHYEVVSAMIPGSKYPDQEFVLIAHLDHYRPGANDNASGSAVLLEIARSFQNMIAANSIEPPLRTIRFLWVPEINGTVPWLAHHPEAFGKIAGVINMDMVGANLRKAKAIFHLTRTPNSLPTYFDDVIQNFTEFARDNNRENFPRDRTFAMVSPSGTRDNFDVGIEPYSGGSDHYLFTDGANRIPAVMFGTWPDVFYHSSEDKPEKVDPTTLKRAAFLGMASMIYFTRATSEHVPRLTMEVMSKARARIAHDEKKAYDLLAGGKADKWVTKYREARNIIFQAYLREIEAVRSCSYFADGDEAIVNYVQKTSDQLLAGEKSSLSRLKSYYYLLCQQAGIKPAMPKLTARENQLSKVVPKRVLKYRGPLGSGFLKSKLDRTFDESSLSIFKEIPRGNAAFGNIPYELLNFVDGKRSVVEIRNAVSAEYCPVSLDVVDEYVQVLEKAGVVKF